MENPPEDFPERKRWFASVKDAMTYPRTGKDPPPPLHRLFGQADASPFTFKSLRYTSVFLLIDDRQFQGIVRFATPKDAVEASVITPARPLL